VPSSAWLRHRLQRRDIDMTAQDANAGRDSLHDPLAATRAATVAATVAATTPAGTTASAAGPVGRAPASTTPAGTPQDYGAKGDTYFGNERQDIARLLPPHAARVLEVGCGSGATLQWLKASGRCDTTVGIELFADAAAVARARVDELHVGNAEILIEGLFSPASFDLVLCLDVLEHMVDPWAFVTRLQQLMKPGALLVASIPNVRYLRVVLPLLLAGRWRYEASGILDRTHLRFFTCEGALALVSPPGLTLQAWRRRLPPLASKSGALNALSLGLLRDLFTMGFFTASKKD
jgi:SAM-dependent methyltransferase